MTLMLGADVKESFQQRASEARSSRLCCHDYRAEKGVVGPYPCQPGSAEQPAVYFCHDKVYGSMSVAIC